MQNVTLKKKKIGNLDFCRKFSGVLFCLVRVHTSYKVFAGQSDHTYELHVAKLGNL